MKNKINAESSFNKKSLKNSEHYGAVDDTLDFNSSQIDYKQLVTAGLETDADSNDKDLLNKISQLVLEREDIHELERNIQFLIDSLSKRVNLFGTKSFTYSRFLGWATVLCNLSGLFNVANMRFLYETGKLIDERFFSNLIYLHLRALDSLQDQFGDVDNIHDWIKVVDDPQYSVRRVIANSLNYLYRDYFIFSRKTDISAALKNHYDILIYVFTFSDIRNDDAANTLYKDVLQAHNEMKKFFLQKTDNIKDKLWQKSFPSEIKRLFLIFTKLSQNLGLNESVIPFKEWYLDFNHTYSSEELTYFLPLIEDKQARLKILFENDYFKGSSDINKDTLLRVNFILEMGGAVESLTDMNFEEYINQANYSDLFYLFNLYKLAPNIFTTDLLNIVRNRLIILHKNNSHNINHLARVTQFNKICELKEGMLNVNKVYDRIYDSLVSEGIEINKNSKDMVLFALSGCTVTGPLFSAITIPLIKQGVQFFNLEDNGFENKIVRPWTKTTRLMADTSNCLGIQELITEPLNSGWNIDLSEGVLELDGINYYQGMYERMSRLFKVFDLNWNMPSVQLFYKQWFAKVDRLLFVLKEIKQVALKEGLKIRLVSLQSQFNPWYVMKTFSAHNSEVFNHITIGSSYENWKNNMGSDSLTTFAMLNNTTSPSPSMPAFGTKEGFDGWYKNYYLKYREDSKKLSQKLVSVKRSGDTSSDFLNKYDDILKDKISSGAKVFCVLGKIPYDMAVPYQGGPAHDNMSDWLNHTVSTIENSQNVLLVKPHPHELNYEISAKPVQGFVDMIHQNSFKNTFILPHRGINIQDLMDYVDVFLCWNGSSIAELGAQGEKVVACDDWARRNYPIEVYLPESRVDYEDILFGKKEVNMHENFQELSQAYIVYLTEAPFSIKYPFVSRSSTNTKFHDVPILIEQFDKKNISYMLDQSALVANIFNLVS